MTKNPCRELAMQMEKLKLEIGREVTALLLPLVKAAYKLIDKFQEAIGR